MAAISSIIAATAVAATVAGTGASIYGASKSASAQASASNQNAITAGFQAVVTDYQAEGLGIQQKQQQLQIATQKKVIGLQQESDDIRRQAATLDATRRQREIIRQGLIARSASLVTATSQGASASGSSALGGAEGQISGRSGVNSLGISQQLMLGNSIFDINRSISETYLGAQDQNADLVAQSGTVQQKILAVQKLVNQSGVSASFNYRDAAAAGGIAAFGSGLSSLGGSLVKNVDTIDRLGIYFTSAFGGYQTSDYGLAGSQITGTTGSAGAIY